MDYRGRSISSTSSLLEALKKMDSIDKKLLIVIKDKVFWGLISIGDIQRAILNNVELDTQIEKIQRKSIRLANNKMSKAEIKDLMINFRMEMCPVLDEKSEMIDLIFWEDFYQDNLINLEKFNIPIVIMAGGLGTRLRPLTNVLPKPLIPIGSKTMLEEIFQRFTRHGCDQFYISVNYKFELIEYYLKSLNLEFNVDCFLEETPLGTAGSLKLLKEKINGTFFVSNCDILIDEDYSSILNHHKINRNEITIITALKHFPIAYGTVETGMDGRLISLKEKPELTFKINSGMYILESHLLDEIPTNKFFHITELIEIVLKRNGRVGAFPISEKSWKDIGNWNDYLRMIK